MIADLSCDSRRGASGTNGAPRFNDCSSPVNGAFSVCCIIEVCG
jgi:hypothetical protein